MIFITNPNNPTGTLIPQKDILALVETGLPLVMDEAYYEFSGQTVAQPGAGVPEFDGLADFQQMGRAGRFAHRLRYFPGQNRGYPA